MDFDFTQLFNSPSFRIFLQEILVLMLIFLVNVIKKIRPEISEVYFDGLRSILITLMPTIALFNALIESHLQIYYAVIVFVIEFVVWISYLRIKYERIPRIITIMFVGILVFALVMYGITYYFFR